MIQDLTLVRRACVGGLAGLAIALAGCSSDEPQWRDLNQRVIDENKVTGRTRELPDVNVPMVLGDGEPVERNKLPVITIAPGVTASLGWGPGARLARVELQPGARCRAQTPAAASTDMR